MRSGLAATIMITAGLLSFGPLSAASAAPGERWSTERANAWYESEPWPIGFNYLPGNAISYTEMWMDYSFDPQRIDHEMELAQRIGFNAVRVVLPFVVWEAEPEALMQRFEQFLKICADRGLKVMPIFFDDCAFGVARDPVFGPQTELIEGWYANGWTPSPGHSMVRDRSTWPRLEAYLKAIMTAHREDPRILLWDIYNEPTGFIGDVSIPLVEEVFRWAREVDPIHPLSVGWWTENHRLNEVIFRHSDVITFHCYLPASGLEQLIRRLQRHGRPLINTEWLNRAYGSHVETCLPLMRELGVGALHWGLVQGRTQTDLPWGSIPGDLEPEPQHDLFYEDMTPFSSQEIATFVRAIKGPDAPSPFTQVSPHQRVASLKEFNAARQKMVPTSRFIPQEWRYRLEPPAGDWTAPNYADQQWTVGLGGFGSPGTPRIKVGTEWTTERIWLRREFQLETVNFHDLHFRLFHDEDIEVYINGELVLARSGWTNRYIELPVPAPMLKALKPGKNVMAVTARQTAGGQGVDIGLVDVRTERWSRQQAWKWHAEQPWLVGANFIPSTAINQLEMWQAESFDLPTIDRELGWAAGLGMNFMRVYLHDLLWQHDRDGFIERIEQFLQVADRHGIRVMFVFFDSVWDPYPQIGTQRPPRPHVHNSGWVQSPSLALLRDPYRHGELKEYVQGVISAFRDDRRVLAWDLYNEPGNRNLAASYRTHEPEEKEYLALHLLVMAFRWAREVQPSQPLTVGVWTGTWRDGQGLGPTTQYALKHSDVISFHDYSDPATMQRRIVELQEYDRPLICTEYLARPQGNTFAAMLPLFREHGIGACNWGLVAGKTQTQYPWDSWSREYQAEPQVWFHDIFRPDGAPFDPAEVELFRQWSEAVSIK
jgi:hypothetical protein